MEKEQLKQAVLNSIEENKERLIEIGNWLYANPEPGFREEKTAGCVKKVLEDCGLSVRDHVAYTGVKATAKGKSHHINLALMGELDSLIMPRHPKADPVTGACHGCGHHAQLTTILGVAMGLVETGLLQHLDGDLTFIGVPAEEVVEQDYRNELREVGKIRFLSGKQEMLALGEFQDVDIVFCSHIMGQTEQPHSWVGHSWNGVIHKTVRFTGKAAHAGLAPEKGINALQAAICGLNNLNGLRERFRDDDHVRVHYIFTKGGDSANVVPDDVRLEFGVRASTVEAMQKANEMVNQALQNGADTIGAMVEIEDTGSYLPCHQNEQMCQLYTANAKALLGDENAENVFGSHRGSSTDCGDVASLIPTIHPYFGGAVGSPHGADFDIINPYAAYVVPAKIAAMTVIDLLWDDAKLARQVKKNFTPVFQSIEEYLNG